MVATTAQWDDFEALFKESGTRLAYRKSEFVIRANETPTGVFFIESGLIKAYDITKYGEENLLILRRPKEVFPIIWAITGEERHVIYETLLPCVLWQLPRERFTEFMRDNPASTAPLLDLVVDMYRVHSERILTLEYRSVRERLVSFLLMMSERFGKETEHGLQIDVPLRHQDIASSINASRETTSREIAVLERRGLVKSGLSSICLLEPAALKALL